MFSYIYKKIIVSLLILIPFSVYAADSQLGLTFSPEAPGPFEQVTVSVESYSFDVNTAYIEWSVNGVPFTAGLGVKKIQVVTGAIGKIVSIVAKVSTRDGEVLESSAALSPQSVELVWESVESFVPPFYEGKALPGEGSIIKVTALPNFSDGGVQVSPQNLSFLWYGNDTYLEQFSGTGRQVAFIPLDILSDFTQVKVRVRSTLGGVAEKKMDIYPRAVIPAVYLYDEILGTKYERMFTNRLEASKDFTISFVPYFLSTRNNLDQKTDYLWLLDGLPVTPQEKTLLTLRPKENSFGTKRLSLRANSTTRTLQRAQADIELIFDTRK